MLISLGLYCSLLSSSADDLFTARSVTGVEALQKRFPEADGRHTKIAILDTGIDFGVPGLFKSSEGEQKLIAFYDFTGFGKVQTSLLSDSRPKNSYQRADLSLSFDIQKIKPRAVKAIGILSEEDLAKNYFSPKGIDLNDNASTHDVFIFLVGVNAEGEDAVWIDLDQSGVIRDRSRQELTDFNQTHKYLDFRIDVGPSGARPLAVSILPDQSVQFHSVVDGHATECALVAAGDDYATGHLKGMAPKAKLYSYVLDAVGLDTYSLTQLTDSLLDAKAKGVDAISISWGFPTGDLASARYLADFIDREIADAGIIVGIASGNEGPGMSSANADYFPHHGFSVGAELSKTQAENVYGWTGTPKDTVIWYSSFGPTLGGRLVPDMIAPLASLVRGERSSKGARYHGFTGTSSATPALVGSLTALAGALKAKVGKIDIRLLKLAVEDTAKPLTDVMELRQGAGLVDVNAAYDRYLLLLSDIKSAYPVELRAETDLEGLPQKGEGIHLTKFRSSAQVQINLSAESLTHLDHLEFIDPLKITHSKDFFKTENSLLSRRLRRI